jgi:hypothetical protein
MVNKIKKEERFLFNLSKNMKQENVHIKFGKFSLGVGKRTTNIAVLGELGATVDLKSLCVQESSNSSSLHNPHMTGFLTSQNYQCVI